MDGTGLGTPRHCCQRPAPVPELSFHLYEYLSVQECTICLAIRRLEPELKPWNVLVTSLLGQERIVFRKLRQAGEFRRCDFKDVFLGWTDDMEAFLGAVLVNTLLRERVGKVVPIELTFSFQAEDFEEKLGTAALSLLPRLADSSFHVRMERRGFKGRLNSLGIEQEMDRLLKERLLAAGNGCEIDFKDPDHIVVVETVAAWGGVGLITREMKERYPFIKVK